MIRIRDLAIITAPPGTYLEGEIRRQGKTESIHCYLFKSKDGNIYVMNDLLNGAWPIEHPGEGSKKKIFTKGKEYSYMVEKETTFDNICMASYFSPVTRESSLRTSTIDPLLASTEDNKYLLLAEVSGKLVPGSFMPVSMISPTIAYCLVYKSTRDGRVYLVTREDYAYHGDIPPELFKKEVSNKKVLIGGIKVHFWRLTGFTSYKSSYGLRNPDQNSGFRILGTPTFTPIGYLNEMGCRRKEEETPKPVVRSSYPIHPTNASDPPELKVKEKESLYVEKHQDPIITIKPKKKHRLIIN